MVPQPTLPSPLVDRARKEELILQKQVIFLEAASFLGQFRPFEHQKYVFLGAASYHENDGLKAEGFYAINDQLANFDRQVFPSFSDQIIVFLFLSSHYLDLCHTGC